MSVQRVENLALWKQHRRIGRSGRLFSLALHLCRHQLLRLHREAWDPWLPSALHREPSRAHDGGGRYVFWPPSTCPYLGHARLPSALVSQTLATTRRYWHRKYEMVDEHHAHNVKVRPLA